MNLKFTYSIITVLYFIAVITKTYGQEVEFDLAPYIKGLTNVKDGFFEIGPVIYNSKMEIKPYLRLPISDKENAIAQVDRNTDTFKGILAYSYILDLTKETGPIKRLYLTGQFEIGTDQYKYFPDSIETRELKVSRQSYSGEFKIGFYKTQGESFAKQLAPEFRIRYSLDYERGSELGTVVSNANGVSTIKNLIVQEPSVKPLLSPAMAFNYYPGEGNFSYTPVIYYNFMGKEGGKNPFDNFSRLRLESWVYYYPLIKGYTGIKIGLSPFLSVRTNGTDSLNKVEYGGLIQLLVGTNMLNFL